MVAAIELNTRESKLAMLASSGPIATIVTDHENGISILVTRPHKMKQVAKMNKAEIKATMYFSICHNLIINNIAWQLENAVFLSIEIFCYCRASLLCLLRSRKLCEPSIKVAKTATKHPPIFSIHLIAMKG